MPSLPALNTARLPRDFLYARKHERGVSAAHTVPGDRRTQFAIGNHGYPPGRIAPAKFFQLCQQIFCRALHGPVVCRVVATGHAANRFRSAMRGMKQAILTQQQGKMCVAKCVDLLPWAFPAARHPQSSAKSRPEIFRAANISALRSGRLPRSWGRVMSGRWPVPILCPVERRLPPELFLLHAPQLWPAGRLLPRRCVCARR